MRDLFVAALEIEPAQRELFVTSRVADPRIRAEVLDLLRCHGRLGSFLDGGCWRGPHESSVAIRPGERIGEFEIVDYLAHGGGGVVFRARQPALGDREVAIKVVPLVADDGGVASFRREAVLAAHVDHRHLVAIHDAGTDFGRRIAWYAMRLVRGPTLHDALAMLDARGRAPNRDEQRQLVARMTEIAHATGALHAAGLVHGDIKPANIMLEVGTGSPPWHAPALLVDFGVAVLSTAAEPTPVAATLAYAAPERISDHELDARSDVFSFGMTLYDLLSGRLHEHRAGLASHALRPLEDFGVEKSLAAIVRRATSARSEMRQADGRELAEALEEWLARTSRRRVRVVLQGLIGVAVVAVVASGFTGWSIVRRASAAWEVGDLVTVSRIELQSLPLARLGLPASRTADAGVSDVMDVLVATPESASLRALAWLDRDGPGAHPDLERFVAHGVRRAGVDQLGVLRHVATWAIGRPQEDAGGFGSIVDALRGVLDGATAPNLCASAACALGNLGVAEDLVRLLALAENSRGDASSESARVALEAAAVLVRRASTSDAAEFAASWLRDRPAPPVGDVVGGAFERLAVECAFAFRRAGRTSIDPASFGEFGRSNAVGAACGDDRVLSDLIAAGASLAAVDLVEKAAVATQRGWNCIRFGRAAGEHGGVQVIARARAALSREAITVGIDVDAALRRFDEGVAIGGRHRDGDLSEDAPDRDTLLARLLEETPAVAPPLAATALAARILALVRLQVRPFACAGPSLHIELVAATSTDDEVAQDAGYVKLGSPGRSAITLQITTDHVVPSPLWVSIEVQKGARRRLPHLGHAAVDVLLDGAVVHDAFATPSMQRGAIELALTPWLEAGKHRVEVRLAEESNTTLRVFTIAVLQR